MTVLEQIFATKRQEVAEAKARLPLADLQAMARDADAPRGFRRALQRAPGVALIAEVKKASPSQGLIRADFDPVALARTYEAAGANALSVLTDRTYFQGTPEYLREARAAVRLPVLRKDFLDDPYQVWEARAWGADAILLIVASLGDEQIRELQELSRELGMDALVEVHTEEEAARATDLGADLIGVNNRDLATFHTDLATSERILPMVTPFAVAVSESALETADDVRRVAAAGAKAVLIGTTFTTAPDVGLKVREVMAP